MKCMARATTLDPVVGPGRLPLEPATSKWEYLSGLSDETW